MNDHTHDERAPLLRVEDHDARRQSRLSLDAEAASILRGHVTAEELKLVGASIGDRLAYNDYTTIDWLHDLVKDSYRLRFVHSGKGLRGILISRLDEVSGWIAAALIGALTACVAFGVDVASATVSDWKQGYCTRNPFMDREACCRNRTPLNLGSADRIAQAGEECAAFRSWSDSYAASYAIYVVFASVLAIISCSLTMLTKRALPAAITKESDRTPHGNLTSSPSTSTAGKSLFMAAGSGIPELKTILSGFVIPNFLDLKVMVVKAVGSVFAVSSGLCLGKEGPFVHISACVGWLVARHFPKYRDNGRKMREMLSAACAAGLSVAFGAPIGGVLFSYEEISTFFPRRVLWRAFLCSLVAAITLKALNPTGTGKLVLFETNYNTTYNAEHYLVFICLGIVGGLFGGVFCRSNHIWSKWFRNFTLIKNYPVFETAIVVLATALLQYPNPLTREPGEAVIRHLLVDCRNDPHNSWVCEQESQASTPASYFGFLIYGTLTKLVLTIITFGIKVPSGVIIPSLDAGAFFGRLIGQLLPGTDAPGIFAMVGAAAFLAGVSRMTISLCVIMFELTGELEYVMPHMVAVLVAKWTADALGRDGVYDLAQAVLGHPFLDQDHGLMLVQRAGDADEKSPSGDVAGALVSGLIPPPGTMDEITVVVPSNSKVPRALLETKMWQLRQRGLMDAGLVLVQGNSMLLGYLPQRELEFGLEQLGRLYAADAEVRLLGHAEEGEFNLSHFVDRTPMTVSAAAPMEYAVEMFGKLGLSYLMILEEGTAKLVGVIIKKRMVAYLDKLKQNLEG